ncbi:MAG: type III pantothenate kinase [Fuerstiella sp.]
MTILAIDVGNSRAKIGIWHNVNPTGQAADMLTAVPLTPEVDLPTEIRRWLKLASSPKVDQAIVAGSNPNPVDDLMASWLGKEIPVIQIRSYQQIPLKMDVENPETVGIDRLLTAIAVRSRQTIPTSVIVVDAGTATTVNLTTADGTFRGGAILPGMRMSAHALHDYTAVLPLIDADSLVGTESQNHAAAIDPSAPTPNEILRSAHDGSSVIGNAGQNTTLKMPGRHTTSAIQNGIFWGHLGSIKELIAQLTANQKSSGTDISDLAIAITGGGGRQLARLIPNAVYEDSLALIGLSTLARSTNH